MKLSRKILFLFILLNIFRVYAEEKRNLNVRIEQIISKDYPEMTAYTIIKNDKGELVSGLAPGLFSFRIDTAEIKVKSKIVPFSMADEGVDYTIMISNNGIMEGEPLDFQKNALLKFVELMSDRDTLSVYTVGEDAGEVILDVTNKTFDSAVINKIELSEGQPRLYDSVMNLIRKVEQKKGKRKVVIILSDGRDQNSRFSKDQLIETLGSIGFPVYTVGMKVLSNQSLSNLDEISQLTGGMYYYSPRFKDVPDSLKKVVDCVKQSYIIKLKVKNVKADNQAHLLEIKVEETEAHGKGGKTFIAIKHPVPRWLQITFLILFIILFVTIIILLIVRKTLKRKSMGITKRRCPDCRNIMKDNWETCPFCKYMPEILVKKVKKNKEK